MCAVYKPILIETAIRLEAFAKDKDGGIKGVCELTSVIIIPVMGPRKTV